MFKLSLVAFQHLEEARDHSGGGGSWVRAFQPSQGFNSWLKHCIWKHFEKEYSKSVRVIIVYPCYFFLYALK